MKVDDGEPDDVRPGSPGIVVRQVVQRMDRLGLPRPLRTVAAHIEIIAAMRLINAGGDEVECEGTADE